MNELNALNYDNHEKVVFIGDEEDQPQVIIAIHNTSLGPALGGLRFWPYRTHVEALEDVLRLSKGMSYKCAIAGIPFGGGKTVVRFDPMNAKPADLLEKIGHGIKGLDGKYITGEDVGSTVEDMIALKEITDHVMGAPVEHGGSGDPSASTALGCFVGIQASTEYALKTSQLHGARVAVQGVGNVGWNLCKLLFDAGAQLVVSDVSDERAARCVTEFGAHVVGVNEIYDVEADIFAPCALGAVVNNETLKRMKFKVIAGGANNQLATAAHGEELHKRGILYAPDYVMNAGGVIQFAFEREAFNNGTAYDPTPVAPKIREINGTLLDIFAKADEENSSTSAAADLIAEQLISGATDQRQ